MMGGRGWQAWLIMVVFTLVKVSAFALIGDHSERDRSRKIWRPGQINFFRFRARKSFAVLMSCIVEELACLIAKLAATNGCTLITIGRITGVPPKRETK